MSNNMTAQEVSDLQDFQCQTNSFAQSLFEHASALGVQYLLPHIYDLQREIQGKIHVPDTDAG